MNIVVAGGSGFIGEPLVKRLLARGDSVAVLSRNPAKVSAGRALQWDGKTQGAWRDDVANADVVINLAGENVGEGRWTAERKRRLIDSRIDATRALVEALQSKPSHARTFINASAVGIYGFDRGDAVLDENAPRGNGFLADLVVRWEEAARAAEPLARVVAIRFGVVLAPEGGALAKMLLPFKLGGGGPIGSGKQWMSWIDREDVLRMIEWAIDTPKARGVYNATAPNPVANRDFARTLGHVLHRPSLLPAPAFALRAAFGEMAGEILLGGQRVVPSRAQADGFVFRETSLEGALRGMLSRG
ncbi:MAG TPA: TIGR01777 family oxidoreductase [Thermoanaerobaculia bacterium]|nr:TIGR01777 family oxidoreductase [Thermoanaerobaculia bacterium]